MKNFYLILLLFIIFSCKVKEEEKINITVPIQYNPHYCDDFYTLNDFYSEDSCLTQKVDSVFNTLSTDEKLGQMFVIAYGENALKSDVIIKKIETKSIGGVLMLKGSKGNFQKKIKRFTEAAKDKGALPLIYSADAEFSLINHKIAGLLKIKKANSLETAEDVIAESNKINEQLKDIGIHQNFAPTSDKSFNKDVISNRSFSKNDSILIHYSKTFILEAEKAQIVPTVKHFPGHGNVKGDSHFNLVYIDGPLTELENFSKIIPQSISVMVGHIAMKNNEYVDENLPATCSSKIITGLLRNKLNYDGLVITDAMNMFALNAIKNPDYKAIKAGADMVLMPRNIDKTITLLRDELLRNPELQKQIDASVRRIIKLKICLGLI